MTIKMNDELQQSRSPYAGAHQQIRDFVRNMFFRQSLIKTYKGCPQKAMYTLLDVEAKPPWFASVLGTAGHDTIRNLLETQQLELNIKEIDDVFYESYKKAMRECEPKPKIGAAFKNHEEEYDDKAPLYVEMIHGFLNHKTTRLIRPQIFEQDFVLELPYTDPLSGEEFKFLFKGTIDLGSFDISGLWRIDDFKFRDDAFRYTQAVLDLDTQITVYSYASKYGVPVCSTCKPRVDPLTFETIWHGPCGDCNKLIGTSKWPQLLPDKSSIVWMRDFLKHEKNEYKQFVQDPHKRKQKNPLTGKMKIIDVLNPKFAEGYKAGDYVGPGYLETTRDEDQLKFLIGDVARICSAMANGLFYRNESKECDFMCEYRNQCLNSHKYIENMPSREAMATTFTDMDYDPFN